MAAQLNLNTIKLGNNADTSKNFLISVPAIADGTLTISRENGAQVVATINAAGQVVFPGNVQTWQDVKASRALNTIYTNGTGQPIQVVVTVQGTGGIGQAIQIALGGVYFYGSSTPNTGSVANASFSVPAGATYSVVLSPTTGQTVVTWLELR